MQNLRENLTKGIVVTDHGKVIAKPGLSLADVRGLGLAGSQSVPHEETSVLPEWEHVVLEGQRWIVQTRFENGRIHAAIMIL